LYLIARVCCAVNNRSMTVWSTCSLLESAGSCRKSVCETQENMEREIAWGRKK